MGVNFQGLARPAPGANSPQPSPSSAAPTILVPVDGDPNNVSSRQKPQYQALADDLAWINGSMLTCPPILPGSAASGFSSVTHVGTDTGTVTPSGSVKIASGINFVVQIQLGGAVGTATFKTSVDGGNTYGALQTTAASMTDATSGITLAFANHFTATETYQFHSALTPILAHPDVGGIIRSLTDHNGYRFGRINERIEDWIGLDTTTTFNANGILTGSVYHFSQSTGTLTSSMLDVVNGAWNGMVLNLNPGSTNGQWSKVWAQGFAALATTGDLLTYAVEWQANATGSGVGTNQSVLTGMSSVAGASDAIATGNFIGFTKDSADANWQCQAGTFGGSITKVDSGVVVGVAGGIPYRFRLVIFSKDTPLGVFAGGVRVALFFINETLVAAIPTNVPTGTFFQSFQIKNTGASSGNALQLGPVRYAFNQWAAALPF